MIVDVDDGGIESLEAMPLHHAPTSETFACEHPERPAGDGTSWDWRCRACVLHARAVLHNQGDMLLQAHAFGDRWSETETPISTMIARAERWHATHGTPITPLMEVNPDGGQ